MNQGGVMNYGWFEQIGKLGPGWIVEVFAPVSKTYIVAVVPDQLGYTHKCYELGHIPWSCWAGNSYSEQLHRGDCPEDCQAAKLELTRS